MTPSFRQVRDRLAALQDRGDAVSPDPVGAPTPGQADAMGETLEILSDPAMLARVQAGRRAVAIADTVPLAQVVATPAAGDWAVVVTGPAARELVQAGDVPERLGAVLNALATSPAEQGRALGMGLVGVWSARSEAGRVLYAVHREQRLVTVLSVDAG